MPDPAAASLAPHFVIVVKVAGPVLVGLGGKVIVQQRLQRELRDGDGRLAPAPVGAEDVEQDLDPLWPGALLIGLILAPCQTVPGVMGVVRARSAHLLLLDLVALGACCEAPVAVTSALLAPQHDIDPVHDPREAVGDHPRFIALRLGDGLEDVRGYSTVDFLAQGFHPPLLDVLDAVHDTAAPGDVALELEQHVPEGPLPRLDNAGVELVLLGLLSGGGKGPADEAAEVLLVLVLEQQLGVLLDVGLLLEETPVPLEP
mmetsp:Transcript_23758/g.49427  ORF Transcript_23758/g.49427 Transcript_23758/m.49427 type:complete len:259 (+) Transcript_23758:135-911(+)